MNIWLASPSRSGPESTVPGDQAGPFSPSVTILKFVPPADFKSRTGRIEGRPFALAIEAAEVTVKRIVLSEFAPAEHVSLGAGLAKAGKACGPRTEGPAEIYVALHPGLTERSGRPPGARLATPPPFGAEPRVETEAWHATSLRPSQPLPSKPASLAFEPQTGTSIEIRRPKQALKELVLPSARPWQSLTIFWQSFRGFHFAFPAVEVASEPRMHGTALAALWNTPVDGCSSGPRLLCQSAEIAFEHEPSAEGACPGMLVLNLISIDELCSPGFDAAIRGSKLPLRNPDPFTQMVRETLPLAKSVETPAPQIALTQGLSIWNATINSYIRRNLWSPRLREGGRVIHTLRLAPVIQVNESCEISVA